MVLSDILAEDMKTGFDVVVPRQLSGFMEPAWDTKLFPAPTKIDFMGAHYSDANVYQLMENINHILSTLIQSSKVEEMTRWYYVLDYVRFEVNKHIGEISIGMLQPRENKIILRYLNVITTHTHWDGMKLSVIVSPEGFQRTFETEFRQQWEGTPGESPYQYSYFNIPEKISQSAKEFLQCYIKVAPEENYPFHEFAMGVPKVL
jgi:hypothetical protein